MSSIKDMQKAIHQNKLITNALHLPSDLLQNIIHGNEILYHSNLNTLTHQLPHLPLSKILDLPLSKLPHLPLSKLPSIQPLKITINSTLFKIINIILNDPLFDPNSNDDNGDFHTIALITFFANGCDILLNLKNKLKHYNWNKLQNISGRKFKLIDIALLYNNVEFVKFLLEQKSFPSLFSSTNNKTLYQFYAKHKNNFKAQFFNNTIKEIISYLLLNQTPNINDFKAIQEHQCSIYISQMNEITSHFVYKQIYKGYLLSLQNNNKNKIYSINNDTLQNKLKILYYLVSENGSLMHKINGYSAIYYLIKIKCANFIHILIKENKINIQNTYDKSKETLYNLILRTFNNNAKFIHLIKNYKSLNASFKLTPKEIRYRDDEHNQLHDICGTKNGFWNTFPSDSSDNDEHQSKHNHNFQHNIKEIHPNTLDLIEEGDLILYNNRKSLVITIDKSKGNLSLESPICHEYDQIYRKRQKITFNKHTIKVSHSSTNNLNNNKNKITDFMP